MKKEQFDEIRCSMEVAAMDDDRDKLAEIGKFLLDEFVKMSAWTERMHEALSFIAAGYSISIGHIRELIDDRPKT